MRFNHVEEGEVMNLVDVVLLFGAGVSCGLVLSILPFVAGELINFGLSFLKKGR